MAAPQDRAQTRDQAPKTRDKAREAPEITPAPKPPKAPKDVYKDVRCQYDGSYNPVCTTRTLTGVTTTTVKNPNATTPELKPKEQS